jgi:hypothetical protein
MSDQLIADYSARLRACLDAPNIDAELVRLSDDHDILAQLPRDQSDGTRPHQLVGLATSLMAGALTKAGRPAYARAFVERVADLFAPARRHYVRGTNFGDMIATFPFLWVSLTIACLALRERESAVGALLRFGSERSRGRLTDSFQRKTPEHDWFMSDPTVQAVLQHPAVASHGPFCFDHTWVLDRQGEVLRLGPLNRQLEETYEFYELFVENALVIEQPSRALPVIDDGVDLLDATVSSTTSGHFGFDAACVFAALGRFDEALTIARRIARSGYELMIRFDIDAAQTMPWWTDLMRQNDWLEPLAATEAYQQFIQEERAERQPIDLTDPTQNPLCAVRDGVLGGKAKRRCWLTRERVSPGEHVVRVRRLLGHASDGDFDIIKKDAFETSNWARARQEFEEDRIPLHVLLSERCHTPGIMAFRYDLVRKSQAFDLDRAVGLIADHNPNPIRFEWIADGRRQGPAFDPMINDRGHGDAVNFAWRLLKAGYGPQIFHRLSGLPQDKVDKVFAMLATFDRADCRRAAADHFGIADLPAMIEGAFRKRLSLDDYIALADFAEGQPRFRAGLASAMRAYALHLYSNNRPETDWFLQGLEHFSHARCSHLLFFLIHHPEDDRVLSTMIERGWVPQGIGSGGFDAYNNACEFYVRAAAMHSMIHVPERLDYWLQYCSKESVMGRETLRLVERWRKRRPST